MDPLTGAVLTLAEIRDMVIEMFEAESQWLPQFKGKSLPRRDAVTIPEGIVPAEVPIDPALAINSRFGKLGE
jgi:alpha-galactosidase